MAMPTGPQKRGLSKNAWIGIGLVGAFVLVAVIGRLTVGTGADTAEPGIGDVIVDTTTARAAQPPAAVPEPPSLPTAAPASCSDAPARIVQLIDASFTDGEHLDNAQSIDGPKGTVVVGGNITAASGERVSSQDSWVMSGGQVFTLTSSARRHSMLPDGRDILVDWSSYNDDVGECVGAVTRAANP